MPTDRSDPPTRPERVPPAHTSTGRPDLRPRVVAKPEKPTDPRHRWPAAVILCTWMIAMTCALVFVEDTTVRVAVLAILGTLSVAIAAAVPSMFAPVKAPK